MQFVGESRELWVRCKSKNFSERISCCQRSELLNVTEVGKGVSIEWVKLEYRFETKIEAVMAREVQNNTLEITRGL